jgi:hypothetical protein
MNSFCYFANDIKKFSATWVFRFLYFGFYNYFKKYFVFSCILIVVILYL